MIKIIKWFNNCGNESEINIKGGYCEYCKKWLKPCSMCDMNVIKCNLCKKK